MENTTTRKRTKKAGAPEVVALKKSVSAALKAAWHVEQLRARIEKPKRERNTLAKKLELQRAALEQVKATVEGLLEGLKPAGKPLVETFANTASVVLEPGAGGTAEETKDSKRVHGQRAGTTASPARGLSVDVCFDE